MDTRDKRILRLSLNKGLWVGAAWLTLVTAIGSVHAQTAGDTAHTTALENFIAQTQIGGYGEARYHYDLRFDTAQADLQRATLFFSHTFSPSILFYSELEIEDGKVEGGTGGGEVSYEQMYLRFRVSGENYLMAGLMTPRIGIMNENHLPTTFNGTDRPFVETMIIPSTWRDIGIEMQGPIDAVPGMNYSAGIFNGLSSANFHYGEGVNGGSFEGKLAQASELAITGALQYYTGTTRLQASAYYGGTVGLDTRQADSLQLDSGPFGTPVFLTEADVMSTFGAFSFRALGTFVSIADAQSIDRAYANNTPQAMEGAYAEIGYDVLHNCPSKESLTIFTRAEYLDLNAELPANGVYNGELLQRYLVAGLTWKPLENVSVKGDYVYRFTGSLNPALQINPIPQQVIYYQANGFWDIGMAYSF
ncbi:MAG TPA: hypothetical protein VGM92_12690 [Candidatus Kapabacteria bacterium]|jgi:hypothetical protein